MKRISSAKANYTFTPKQKKAREEGEQKKNLMKTKKHDVGRHILTEEEKLFQFAVQHLRCFALFALSRFSLVS